MNYIHANKGRYKCNGKPFYSKLEAILESNKTGKQIHWDFYDSVFDKYNWESPSTLDIDQLYKMRAEQLRSQYDHLVLFYSGGVDSGYILKTFLENDIKIDEIYIYGAFDLERKSYDKIGTSTKAGYYTREVEYIARPLIKELLKKQQVKISEYDWTEDIINATNDLDWFWLSGSRFTPDQMVRSKFHKIFKSHNELLDKGKKVGFIYGVDKPRLTRDDDAIYCMFLDLIMTTGTNNTNDILNENWENDEFFYWTPNFPEIVIKQAHIVANYFKENNRISGIRYHTNHTFHDMDYYQIANRLIYPNWDHGLWQIDKPRGSSLGHELTSWFYDPEATHFKKWKSSLGELETQLGKDKFNNNNVFDGLQGHISPLYKICNL
jgi:hypothetical protein